VFAIRAIGTRALDEIEDQYADDVLTDDVLIDEEMTANA
jgi:hypothetical protein